MRAAIGLVGILVAIGVLVWLWGPGGGLDKAKQDIDVLHKTQETLKPMTSAGAAELQESLTIELQTVSGKSDSVLVVDVKPGGPGATHFGLQRGDGIMEIGPYIVKSQVQSDDDAWAYLKEAYGRKYELKVVRNGQTITLPATTAQGSQQPAGGLQGQLDAIKNSPR